VKSAVEVFTFERRSARSPMVEQAWRTHSEPEESFISAAASHWEMVVTRQRDSARLTVRGPETRATAASIPQDADFFGIQFTHGTYMPGLAPGRLVDSSFTATPAGKGSVWLDGCRLELPDPENADVFVERLVGAGVLVHDPVAAAALRGDVAALSTRSIERRVARAIGLTRGAVRQIRRAERAVELLCHGLTPIDVVQEVGYADQSHLTRSLKRLVGRTPSQITAFATVD
jgi:Helix-turn-helix domain